jgi:hypothetical protein
MARYRDDFGCITADLRNANPGQSYPWKDSPEHIDQAVEHARRFLKAHVPVTV